VKKILFVTLALIVMLGAMGVGYAMWSDTIIIEGKVETGCVDLRFDGISESYVYKVMAVGGYTYGGVDYPYRGVIYSNYPIDEPDDVLLLVASATVDYDPADPTVFYMTFDNLLPTPGFEIHADVLHHYACDVPAHVYVEGPVWVACETGGPVIDLSRYIDFRLLYEGVETPWREIQLHNGDWLDFYVFVDGELLQADGIDAMNLGPACFKFKMVAYQWNETYVP
jgi:hypothetical protein